VILLLEAEIMSLRSKHRHARHGATMVLVALLLVVVVGSAAFAIEVGRMYLLRSQLQSAVDAGALAASLQLRNNPNGVTAAAEEARKFVRLNRVGWLVTVPDNAIAVEAGTWDSETKTFTVGGDRPSAVRVFARQDDEPLFFGNLFGRSVFGTPQEAVAAGGSQPLDIMMVLDLSSSMADQGRIEALRNSAPIFVDVVEGLGGDDQIGVMCYGARPEVYNPVAQGHQGQVYTLAPADLLPSTDATWMGVLERDLTNNFDGLRSGALASNQLSPAKYIDGWTPTGAALRDAAHYLSTSGLARGEAKKVIVLMSDGWANRPTDNGPGYALQMAAYAAGLEIEIYTISLGNEADIPFMESIAEATGGQHFDATGSGESELTQKLTEAFQAAALAIKRAQLVK
jgi:hypothetical protein